MNLYHPMLALTEQGVGFLFVLALLLVFSIMIISMFRLYPKRWIMPYRRWKFARAKPGRDKNQALVDLIEDGLVAGVITRVEETLLIFNTDGDYIDKKEGVKIRTSGFLSPVLGWVVNKFTIEPLPVEGD